MKKDNYFAFNPFGALWEKTNKKTHNRAIINTATAKRTWFSKI